QVEFDAAGFQLGDGQEVLDEEFEPLRVAVNSLEKAGGDVRVVFGAVNQGFDIAFDQGKGSAQFMADVGHEFFTCAFELLKAGQIVKDEDGAVAAAIPVGDRGAIDLNPALVSATELEFVAEDLLLRAQELD